MTLSYLATPYSDPDPHIRQYRYEKVTALAGNLMQQGHFIFSPITHCHPMALVCDLPTDFDYWYSYCNLTLSTCSELFVYKLPGWEKSKGVQQEIVIATRLGLPISYITP